MARQGGSATRRRGRTTAYAVAAALLCATPAVAGSAPRLGPPPAGVAVRPAPAVLSWACLRDCAAVALARRGSVVRLRGSRLRRAAEVVFEGSAGVVDDVAAAPFRRRGTRIDVQVPLGAVAGPLVVTDGDGQRSAPAAAIGIEPPVAPAAGGAPSAPGATPAAAPPSVDVQALAPRAYFDAERAPAVAYVVHGGAPASVLVELVRARDGVVVESWAVADVPPELPQTLTWDGTAGGRLQPAGRYAFRVTAESASGLRAVSAQAAPSDPAPDPAQFVFARHLFPVRGPHGYGEHAAAFGGGRGHQGQDVFAACGTPLVAARGGVVKFKQYHGRAGHYIVVDGHRTSVDYAYMHLREAALVDEGDRVRTGQPIGYVGDTGSADGCHLHLELWSEPGWYSGGQPYDPLPSLLAWDRRS